MSFPGWQYVVVKHQAAWRIMQAWKFQKLHVWDSPDLAFCVSPFAWLCFLSFCYNETMICSIALYLVTWVVLANYQTWWGSRNRQICRQLVRRKGGLGSPRLWLVVRWKAVSCRHVPLTYETPPHPVSCLLSPVFSAAQILALCPWRDLSLTELPDAKSLLGYLSIGCSCPLLSIKSLLRSFSRETDLSSLGFVLFFYWYILLPTELKFWQVTRMVM